VKVDGAIWKIEGFEDNESSYDAGRIKMKGIRIVKEGTDIAITDIEKATPVLDIHSIHINTLTTLENQSLEWYL
jgi:hypothetical protein